jgi:valyl-tRNA synthetase
MLAPYPTAVEGWTNPALDKQYEAAQAITAAIRKLRTDYNLMKQRPAVYVSVSSSSSSDSSGFVDVVQQLAGDIACLGSCSEVVLLQEGVAPPQGCSVAIVNDAVTVHMQLKVRASGGVMECVVCLYSMYVLVCAGERRPSSVSV